MLLAPCIRCGRVFHSDPELVPSVYVHTATRCSLAPDGTEVKPGGPDVVKEPLCDPCALLMRRVTTPRPIAELFPHARLDLIKSSRGTPS